MIPVQRIDCNGSIPVAYRLKSYEDIDSFISQIERLRERRLDPKLDWRMKIRDDITEMKFDILLWRKRDNMYYEIFNASIDYCSAEPFEKKIIELMKSGE